MFTKGIRGAITVEGNSSEAIKNATLKLLKELIKRNNIDQNLISHAIFSLTSGCPATLGLPNFLKFFKSFFEIG